MPSGSVCALTVYSAYQKSDTLYSRDHAIYLSCRDRHEINNYSQLHFMLSQRIQRSQLPMPNMCVSNGSLRVSHSRITPISTGHVSVLPQDEMDEDDPPETQVHEEARETDAEGEDKDKDDFLLPEGGDNGDRGDTLSKITEEVQKEIFEQNQMLLKLQFEQSAESKEERTRILTELDRS
jgi:hypothetical protein